jgi:hypothetical protein
MLTRLPRPLLRVPPRPAHAPEKVRLNAETAKGDYHRLPDGETKENRSDRRDIVGSTTTLTRERPASFTSSRRGSRARLSFMLEPCRGRGERPTRDVSIRSAGRWRGRGLGSVVYARVA